MANPLHRLKEARPRIIRCYRGMVGGGWWILFIPLITGWLAALVTGVPFSDPPMIILIGTALSVHFTIQLLLKPRVLQPVRRRVSSFLANSSPILGFSLLMLGMIVAMVTEVILLRNFVRPADSWIFVVLGFLFSIVKSVLHRMEERSGVRKIQEPEDLEAPAWIRYNPPAQEEC